MAASDTARSDRRSASVSARNMSKELRGFFSRPMTSFYLVIMITLALVTFGLVMMASASAVDSIVEYGSPYYLFTRQLVWVGCGLVAMYAAMRVPLSFWRRVSGPLMVVSVLMLMLVLVPGIGSEVYGGRRWFNLGPLHLQPSEVGKVAFVLWGAHLLVSRKKLLNRWSGLLIPLLPGLAILAGLVVIEPDLGTTMTYLVLFLALLWAVGAPVRLFVLMGLGAVGAGIVAIWAEPYRLARVTSFLDPWADPAGAGHQALQGFYALGSGGLTGVGLGNSRTKWGALPNGHSDYIFAIIGEELGLIGCATVLLLFAALAYVGLRIAHRSTDPFIKLVASATVIWQVAQALINIGYVVGLLPVTGITLPLISSGGTSLIITLFMMGVLATCARHEPAAVAHLNKKRLRLPAIMRLPVPRSARDSDPFSRGNSARRRPRQSAAATRAPARRTPKRPVPATRTPVRREPVRREPVRHDRRSRSGGAGQAGSRGTRRGTTSGRGRRAG